MPPIGTKVHALLRCSLAPLSSMVQNASMIVDHSVLVLKKYRKEEEAKGKDALVIKEKVTKKTDRMPLAPFVLNFQPDVLCWLYLIPAYINKFVFIS